MPISSQSTPSSVVWGKRPREGEEELFVRFSELSPAQKLERRRQERQEKKEKQRTIAYFESMQSALAECQQNVSQTDVDNSVAGMKEPNDHGGNSLALVSLIDGFFSELFKLLRADVSFNLLRNNVVCKTIDAALANATLLHSKSLLHLFLGHAFDLITSPVASYTVEMLLINLTQSFNNLKCNGLDDEYNHEMTLGSSGMHVGSGVASTTTLLSAFVEEVNEHLKDIVCHEIGARALRSILLILAGHSLHNAPQLQYEIRFDTSLDLLTEAIVCSFYEMTSNLHPYNNQNNNKKSNDDDYDVDEAYNMWMFVAHASTTLSLIAQSLLKISVAGSKASTLVQSSIERAASKIRNRKLLVSLLHDDKGVFLFQAYITVPTPAYIIAMCNSLDLSSVTNIYASVKDNQCDEHNAVEELIKENEEVNSANNAQESERCTEWKNVAKDKEWDNKKKEKKRKNKCKNETCSSDSHSEFNGSNNLSHEHVKLIFDCAWANALNITVAELPQMLNTESNEVQSLSYVLQDLTLYAPSSIHLSILWRQIIQPNLTAMFEIPLLAPVLTSFAKKCAFNSNSLEEVNTTNNNVNYNSSTNAIVNETHVPADIIEILLNDRRKGITFFNDIPRMFQMEVVSALSTFMLSRASKGAIHFLLVENKLGNKGSELARYLLHVHFSASVAIQNSVDKLRLDDLLALLRTHRGSVVMQEFVRAAAQRAMRAKAEQTKRTKYANHENSVKRTKNDGSSEVNQSEEEREALRALPRFVRRLLPHLPLLASDTFAAFVIEVLYEVGDVELKEQLLHGLVPLYEQMKKEKYAPMLMKSTSTSDNVNTKNTEIEVENANGVNPLLVRQGQFILRKVLRKCCVEQFVHRNADWRKSAERQAQVQRLMYRILLQPTN